MRKMNCTYLVMLCILCLTPLFGQSQALTLTASANSFYPGYEPAKAVDKNASTAFGNYGNPYLLTITFSKTVKAARIRVLANSPGLYIMLKSEEYTRTLLNDESFYIIDPSGFNNIVISGSSLVYEVEATEIALNSVTLPLTYDAAGNNTYRKIVIGSLKSGDLTLADTIENDKTII